MLGTKGQGPLKTERPRKGVRIVRDRFDVPHIYGTTNDDVTFCAGWAHRPGSRAAARADALQRSRCHRRRSGARGDRPDRRGCKSFQPSAQTEREVAKEAKLLRERYGKRGRRFLHDIDVFVKGINA